jgi:hypothetical protein
VKESTVSRDIRLAYAHGDVRLFRNNVGTFIQSNAPFQQVSRALAAAGITFRLVKTGLCDGSSDLIGWKSVPITGDMIGSKLAVFTAIECKAPKARTEANHAAQQLQFIRAVEQHGGYAGMAESVEQAALILRI